LCAVTSSPITHVNKRRFGAPEEVLMPWSNQGGGPWGSGGGGGGGGGRGPWGSGPQPSGSPPDLEELLRRSQDKLRTVLPGGNLGGKGMLLILAGAIAIWGFSGFFRVQPDELGVVLQFGKYVRDARPGLNYHLPYPIETVLTPKVTRVNRIDVGMRLVEDLRRGSTIRDVPEESLMLTGDENIVDVDFSVFWVVKPNGAGDYLFNIQMPEGTVKAVAESAMREIVGRSDIQPILTGARQTIENQVQELMQKVLDHYSAGIQVTQVQLQKVDPPNQVIDAFRDVQAARADLERAQNEAQTYANRVVPEAKGRAAQIFQSAEAFKQQTVAEATGQTARYLSVYEEYKKAPEVTRQRIYLETMERLFATTDKIILDTGTGTGNGVVPYLPLDQLPPRRTQQSPQQPQPKAGGQR
jgi:modulator of FtsH protease HflK